MKYISILLFCLFAFSCTKPTPQMPVHNWDVTYVTTDSSNYAIFDSAFIANAKYNPAYTQITNSDHKLIFTARIIDYSHPETVVQKEISNNTYPMHLMEQKGDTVHYRSQSATYVLRD